MLSTLCDSLALFVELDPIGIETKALLHEVDFFQWSTTKDIPRGPCQVPLPPHSSRAWPNMIDLSLRNPMFTKSFIPMVPSYIVDLDERVFLVCDLSSCQHREPSLAFSFMTPFYKLGIEGFTRVIQINSRTAECKSCVLQTRQILHRGRLVDF